MGKTKEIQVNNNSIKIKRIHNVDYISLTDLAKYVNEDDPSGVIRNWMSNKNSFAFYSLWEEINNMDFNSVESHGIKISEVPYNRFTMTPNRWKKEFNAIGIIPSSGRYRMQWNANRILTKANYLLHTEAIKNYIVPELTDEQKQHVYAEEADVLNVALFGMTAKEWRLLNPEEARGGNIRDYTDLLHLIILNNLENINAELIALGMSQNERLVRLNVTAKNQIKLLKDNARIKELTLLVE